VEGFFNSLFAGCALATETLDGVRKVVRAVLEAFIEDGVVYLELRTTPRTGKDYTVVQYFNTIVEEANKYPDIEVRVIVSLNRAIKTMEVYDTLIEDIQKVNDWKRNIVGMDFCGDPRCRTFKEFLPLLHSARKLGLGLTIHTA
jgi:adenosine deaminase